MIPDLVPSFLEDDISKLPALHLLQNLGFAYVSPSEALEMRGGRRSNVILDEVLRAQLRRLNTIRFKGQKFEFSEANIQSAISELKDVLFDGLVRTNEKITDLLALGESYSQTIEGDTKSYQLRYVDWDPATWTQNNVFHVVEELEVARTASDKTREPDLVLFVNGIPLAVIECKRPELGVEPAISQMIRNQRDEEIPRLFTFTQLVMGVSKNEALYATTGTRAKFWSVWKEDVDAELAPILARPLAPDVRALILCGRNDESRRLFEELERTGREITPQDRAIYALARPERLLELSNHFTLFDAGEKKIARYQQFFCVRKILKRVRARDDYGRRKGGIIWHTQGSGKSLTMVMLAKTLVLEPQLTEAQIVLVTDRINLDDQIYGTFRNCGIEPKQADSGKDLALKLQNPNNRVIATVIGKFEAAAKRGIKLESSNIFVLVDESHRGQYNLLHSRMRQVLPHACFLGFTGTPVKKGDKDTVEKFGGLIDAYPIRQAVEDKAVVPLLYEGRDVEQIVNKVSIDRWFDIETARLTPEQRADLKKKFATSDQLNKAEQKVKEIAFDISMHFRDNWQGTPFKAQLVAQDKTTALLYKRFLDEFDLVTSEVLISGPDEREGHDETDDEEEDLPAVQLFWKKMMARHGSDAAYNKNLINAFKNADEPEIIIVVDKLLTGFDAPRNTVLYLTRVLRDHTLLQAIARVNRLYEGKEFGYIVDYRGVLQNLNQAFDLYGQLGGFDSDAIEGTLNDVWSEISQLPQRHSTLWNLFSGIKNKADEEEYERLLSEKETRDDFYERLSHFARTLAIAVSSAQWVGDTPEPQIERYRSDLRFFMRLRSAVKKRYSEVVDFREFEARIQKLLDTHVGTGEVEKVTSLVNIFDREAFEAEVKKLGSTASKADTIASRTKKTIIERMGEDPAFFSKFSDMLEAAIRAFREKRMADRDYLSEVLKIAENIRSRSEDNTPKALRGDETARAFFGITRKIFETHLVGEELETVSVEAALAINEIIRREWIVNWTADADTQNRMRNEIEDSLHDLKTQHDFPLSFEEIDTILESCLDIAKIRYAGGISG